MSEQLGTSRPKKRAGTPSPVRKQSSEVAERMRLIGGACLLGALLVALVAFGMINLWPYDTGNSYQAFVNGRSVGGLRSGASIVSQNNSAASLLIVPLLVSGVALLRMSRGQDDERAVMWLAAAILGAVGGLMAYGGFFAQFVEQGDLWLGNPLIVMWLSVILMLAVYGLMQLPSEGAPSNPENLRKGQIGALIIVGLLTVFMLAFMIWGVTDGFIPLWVGIAVSSFMLVMTLIAGVSVARGPRQH